MIDDPRVKRVLKRYRKDSQFSDASLELADITLTELQSVLERDSADPIYSPIELNTAQVDYFAWLIGVEFDQGQYDYFLHTYVRQEFIEEFFADKSRAFRSAPAPEGELPANIAPDKVWCSVRPKDGREQYVARDRDN